MEEDTSDLKKRNKELEKQIWILKDRAETLEKEAGEINAELAGAKRKVLGIIKTDAELMGNQNSGRQGQFHQVDHPLVAELRKQYELK